MGRCPELSGCSNGANPRGHKNPSLIPGKRTEATHREGVGTGPRVSHPWKIPNRAVCRYRQGMKTTQVPIVFETERLLLRQWRAPDRTPFAELNADPIVMAHFPALLTRKESDAIADRAERLIAERGWGAWATEVRATGLFIGFVGLNMPRNDLPISPCVEILWRLGHAHWHQGFATEAARGVLQVGFELLGLTEIVAFTAPTNMRSRAVMTRLGMQMDAATFEYPGLPGGHVLRTHCTYRLPRET